ncbi:glycosyltransferase [uncultured Microbacterium sp.]|uniref:glycosyltransferase n=1 Tax=uncultured Microbacterium sp. TaxID=191216 RepID=UPI0025DBE57C|nr:glycosyltransferase [uncultured Microbacterium sp.]
MTSSGDSGEWRVVQRVVLPDAHVPPGTQELYVALQGAGEILSRTALRLEAGTHASFATYFGAVPRVAWQGSGIDRLRLAGTVDGSVRIRVLGTDAAGSVHEIADSIAVGGFTTTVLLDDRSAGWLWFVVDAERTATISEMTWAAPAPAREPAMASIAITTFNRADDCVALIARLADETVVQERILQVVVADQGNHRIHAHPDFAAAAAPWGDRLVVIEQDNLGGSGGFSRGMLKALSTEASHVLILDDDVVLEPESLSRMLTRAEYAQDEPLIGAHMLRLTEPTRVHSWGERVERRRFWWEPVSPALAGLDVSEARPDRAPVLSEPSHVDFNGWWMCLIPLSVVRALGASLPLFIKWDDAEYALRAARSGHPTLTLPGAALWHVPWTVKDDGLDWQAYYQLHNRLVAALIHSPYRRGGALLRDIVALDVNHVLCAQYGSAAVRRRAVRDVLEGPDHLIAKFRSTPGVVRTVLAEEEQTQIAATDLSVDVRAVRPVAPRGSAATIGRLIRVVAHQFRPVRSVSPSAVTGLRREDGKWWSLGLTDRTFLHAAASGSGFLLQRDRRRALHHLLGAMRSAVVLWWRWPALAREYRAQASALSDAETWSSLFAPREA